jgi:hypothetical protein
MDFNKTVIILRGVSGSGKSSLAQYLSFATSMKKTVEVCCADDYFVTDGEYRFSFSGLEAAHRECREKFVDCLEKGVNLVVVSNTSTRESDLEFYLREAEEHGYSIFSVVVENRHGNKDLYSVPDVTRIRQAEQIKNSLKLL